MADCQRTVVEVNAGPHDRKNAVVSFFCNEGCSENLVHVVNELNADGSLGAAMPAQCLAEFCGCEDEECACCCEVVWMIPEMKAGETRRYSIGMAEQPAEFPGGVQIALQEGKQADFMVGDELFTSYVFQEGIARPFCYPVYGPNRKIVVREVNLPQKESIDHPHHKGLWVAQGAVNDNEDNWSEMNDHAITACEDVEILAEGPVFGEIIAFGDWMSGRRGTRKKMLEEHTRIRVYNTPDNARVMDWIITFVATEGGFHFGDTKEAGTLSARLKESMEERNGGTIRNSFGAVGEAENWGKRAEWVDYFGDVEGEVCGLAIMDHPENHGYPTHWHVRSYGLFTANEWGIHDFTGDNGKRGDLAVQAGDFLTFRFRVFIHSGNTCEADVKGQYMNFVFPPTVKVVE
ncbi:MAG: PmoA family protein [Armatimonadia bacterium]